MVDNSKKILDPDRLERQARNVTHYYKPESCPNKRNFSSTQREKFGRLQYDVSISCGLALHSEPVGLGIDFAVSTVTNPTVGALWEYRKEQSEVRGCSELSDEIEAMCD